MTKFIPVADPPAWQEATAESPGYKILSALMAFVVHGGLIFFLVLGVQWATERVSTGAISVDLWRPGDLSKAGQPETIRTPDSATAADAKIQEPVEALPIPEPIESAKPVVEPQRQARLTQPQTEPADINLKGQEKAEADEKPGRDNAKKDAEARKQQERQERQERQETIAAQKEKAEAERRHQAQREQTLRESLARERAALGGSAGGDSRGESVQTTLDDRERALYEARVKAVIKNNVRYTPGFLERLEGNPKVSYIIALLPDGTIGSITLEKSSGNGEFDRAVKLGIEKTARLPRPAGNPKWLAENWVRVSLKARD